MKIFEPPVFPGRTDVNFFFYQHKVLNKASLKL